MQQSVFDVQRRPIHGIAATSAVRSVRPGWSRLFCPSACSASPAQTSHLLSQEVETLHPPTICAVVFSCWRRRRLNTNLSVPTYPPGKAGQYCEEQYQLPSASGVSRGFRMRTLGPFSQLQGRLGRHFHPLTPACL